MRGVLAVLTRHRAEVKTNLFRGKNRQRELPNSSTSPYALVMIATSSSTLPGGGNRGNSPRAQVRASARVSVGREGWASIPKQTLRRKDLVESSHSLLNGGITSKRGERQGTAKRVGTD